MRSRLAFALLALPSIVLACGGDNSGDAGLDATIDSPTVDSGMDATVDSGDAGDSGDSGDAGDSGTPADAGDASVDAASDASVDAASDAGDAGDGGLDDAGCGSKNSFAITGDAGCGVGVDYSCGTNQYEVECVCVPFGECRCKKNDAGVGGITNYGGCPSCSSTPSFSTLAAGCGIPY
jgi:hypothetical protein